MSTEKETPNQKKEEGEINRQLEMGYSEESENPERIDGDAHFHELSNKYGERK